MNEGTLSAVCVVFVRPCFLCCCYIRRDLIGLISTDTPIAVMKQLSGSSFVVAQAAIDVK